MTLTVVAPSAKGEVSDKWRRRRIAALAAALGLLVASMIIATFIGTASVSVIDVMKTIAFHLGIGSQPLNDLQDAIVWQLRSARVVEAAIVGASLAICGVLLQATTRNPLAEPYLLGTSSGASAGAIAVFLLGLGGGALSVAGGAFLGACLSFVIMLLLLGRRGFDSMRVILIGVIIGQFFSGVSSFILMASGDAQSTYGITHWLLGELAAVRWQNTLITLAVCLPGVLIAWLMSTPLDALAFGEDTAASLGVRVRHVQLTVLILVAAMVATMVAAVGAIGFVGLIVPHAIRFIAGPLHGWLIPFSAVTGAIFLIWADTFARVAFSPQEIPVGVFTAIIGAPLFLIIMRKRCQL